jgi:hypothetical protein
MPTTDYCEIYISGIRKFGLGYVDDFDELLDEIAQNFSDISKFFYLSISLDMNQVYNFFLRVSNYETMTIFLKGVRYKGSSMLNEKELNELQDNIKQQISYIDGLTFQDIEIRCAKSYEFKQLEEK